MNKYKIILILILIVFCYSTTTISQEYTPANVSIKFSPKDGVAKHICNVVTKEEGEVIILASKFTSRYLENCLINIQMHRRSVHLVLDYKFTINNSGKISRLLKSGICVYSDSMHGTAHNKILVAGNEFVFTGSYNFTDDAEYLNAENGVFIRSSEIYKIYKTELINHIKHSALLKSKSTIPDQCIIN